MNNFFTTILHAFQRMDGFEKAAATLMLVALILFAGGLLNMGRSVIMARIRAAQYNRAFHEQTNRFKPDSETANIKDALKSFAILISLTIAALIAAKGF